MRDIPASSKSLQDMTFIDLFAGLGGFRLALESLGARCVYSNEWDKYAQETYSENFGEVPEGDITKVDEKAIPDHDIFLGCLERRCREFGIQVVFTEESYTSKASLADLDEMPVWDGEHRDSHDGEFSGRRCGRGRYFDSRGRCFNADVNGSGNIIRKVFPKAFDGVLDFRYLMCPRRVRLGAFSGDGMALRRVLFSVFGLEGV